MMISKYVRAIKYSDSETLLRNAFNGALYLLPTEEWEKINSDLSSEYESENMHMTELTQERFVVDKENNVKYEREADQFTVIFETTSRCNMNCAYCYETDKNTRPNISRETIENALTYIENVFCCDKTQKRLAIGFIGGEPLLNKQVVIYVYEKTKTLAEKYGRQVSYHIDTNGTVPFDDLYSNFERLHISVSLTLEPDHNKVRPGNGFNSFDRIFDNLCAIKAKRGNSVSIRYNTNDENIDQFDDFAAFTKQHFPVCGIIEPMYTDEYDHNDFKNNLSAEKFRQWNSSKAVDILVHYGFQVPYSIGGTYSPCSAYQDFTCKIFTDGQVSLCNAMPYEQARCNISAICNNPFLLERVYEEYKTYNPVDDPQCRECVELPACMGKLFCRNSKCDYETRFDLDTLAITCVRYFLNGKGEYFPNMF